jgi:hypothetical protein
MDQSLSSSQPREEFPPFHLPQIATMHAPHQYYQISSFACLSSTHTSSDEGQHVSQGLKPMRTPTPAPRMPWGYRERDLSKKNQTRPHLTPPSSTSKIPIEFIVTRLPQTRNIEAVRHRIKSHTTRHYHHHKRLRQQAELCQTTRTRAEIYQVESPYTPRQGSSSNHTAQPQVVSSYSRSATGPDPEGHLCSSPCRREKADFSCASCGFVCIAPDILDDHSTPPPMRNLGRGIFDSTSHPIAIDHEMHENLVYCECITSCP